MAHRNDQHKRATMTDVAREAGVSLKTVSRVINEVTTVDPQLAAKVHQAVEKLGYRQNFAAATLRSGNTTSTIGLVIKDLRNEFYATIASAVAEVAHRYGYQLVISHSGENTDDEMNAVADLCRRRIDGLLIVPTSGGSPGLKREMELGTPMVFIDRRPDNLIADAVVIDNFEGTRAGVGQLIDSGHHRIAVLVDTLKMSTMKERLRGAQQAFTDRDLRLDDRLIVHDVATPEAAAKAAKALLKSANAPTAFFCGNNRSGIGVLQELWASNMGHPLVCFDDFSLSELMPRPFTAIGYDIGALGRQGAELLIRRIQGEDFGTTSIVVPTDLRNRGISPHSQLTTESSEETFD